MENIVKKYSHQELKKEGIEAMEDKPIPKARWTTEEIGIVSENMDKGISVLMEMLPDRTYSAIKNLRHVMRGKKVSMAYTPIAIIHERNRMSKEDRWFDEYMSLPKLPEEEMEEMVLPRVIDFDLYAWRFGAGF